MVFLVFVEKTIVGEDKNSHQGALNIFPIQCTKKKKKYFSYPCQRILVVDRQDDSFASCPKKSSHRELLQWLLWASIPPKSEQPHHSNLTNPSPPSSLPSRQNPPKNSPSTSPNPPPNHHPPPALSAAVPYPKAPFQHLYKKNQGQLMMKKKNKKEKKMKIMTTQLRSCAIWTQKPIQRPLLSGKWISAPDPFLISEERRSGSWWFAIGLSLSSSPSTFPIMSSTVSL